MSRANSPLFWTLVLCLVGATGSTVLASVPGAIDNQAALTFAQRVTCQELVEDVYWAHRIWPKENPRPKPSRSEVLSHAQIAAKVERSLLLEAALEQVWGEHLSEKRIQLELNRMVKSSRQPALLEDVFAALNHDPYLVAECLVRPRLAERIVRERYAWDGSIHRDLRDAVEAELAGARGVSDLEGSGAEIFEATWVVGDQARSGTPLPSDTIDLSRDEWSTKVRELAGRFPDDARAKQDMLVSIDPIARLARHAGQGRSPLFETAQTFAVVEILEADDGRLRVASAHWSKRTFADWLQSLETELIPVTPKAGAYALPKLAAGDPCIDDTWMPTAGSGPPPAACNLSSVWTGTEMIVWGGYSGSAGLNTGGRYDAATDTWLRTSSTGAPSARWAHQAVWTGTEMVVWGGYNGSAALNTGGRYDPSTDSWAPVETSGAPSARWGQLTVWTGSRMIAWGGYDGSTYHNTGGVYDPATDSWTATSTTGAPSARYLCAVVWSTSEMIIWGGYNGGSTFNTGGRYDPDLDSWTETSTVGAPAARYLYHHGVWTGSEMLVWGGHSGSLPLNTGGRYDPSTDSWTATSTAGAPSIRYDLASVWSGSEMIVWSGYNSGSTLDTGGRYDPSTDSWTATSTSGAPSARRSPTAVWTGSEMLVWGGSNHNSTVSFDTGGRYDPSTNSWTAMSMGSAPSARAGHTAVWTGAEMLVWGGIDADNTDTGGRYDAAADTWLATSTTDAPSGRHNHTAVWTGAEMVVWGGWAGSPNYYNTGGRYDPSTDTWVATTTTGAPSARERHTAVWNGTEMIVWGGYNGSYGLNTGGRYDPVADSWTATTTSGAPSSRHIHTAVWADTEMIVWGGVPTTATGGRYDPVADSWTATTTSGAPSPRYYHSSVWTGAEMIVWTGWNGTTFYNTGGRYDPASNSWEAMSTADAPTARFVPGMVWTGSEVVVWGGTDAIVSLNTGGRYDPVADSWRATSLRFAPPPAQNTEQFPAVWTGSEMIVWGGWDRGNDVCLDTGGRYCASGLTGIDFGDAPDPSFPTLMASDGARHYIGTSTLFMGATVDAEADGQPTLAADGDDADGTDDEDGVVFTSLLIPGESADVDVVVSEACLLNAWIDFDNDGSWDGAGEQVFSDEPLSAGSNSLSFPVPSAPGGQVITRFRVDADGGLSYTGAAVGGEVEDHEVTIEALDYSDAPDPSYATLFASDGARHLIGGALYLGATVDGEPDGLPTASADGDDLDGSDDEDGVSFTSALRLGLDATLDVVASAPGLLNAWLDFNADGDWDDLGEQIFSDEALAAGSNNLQLAVPLDAVLGATFARFRLDSAGGLTPTGLADDGEVEDYSVLIDPSAELEVAIADDPDPVVQGAQLTYTLLVSNNGGLEATGVVLTSTLDANVVYVSASIPGCSESSGVVSCLMGAIPGGASADVQIEVTVDAGFTGVLTNAASVTLNEPDPVAANNSDGETTEVIAPDDLIFADGFESGNTDGWSSAVVE